MALALDFEKPLIELERQIAHLKRLARERGLEVDGEIGPIVRKLEDLREEVYGELTPMQRVQVARHVRRPYTLDYIRSLFTDFVELKGDRLFRDDPAIVGGWARFDKRPVVVIGHQKGRDTKEKETRLGWEKRLQHLRKIGSSCATWRRMRSSQSQAPNTPRNW